MKVPAAHRLDSWRTYLEFGLERAVQPREGRVESLYKAMGYSLMAGGKRLRPLLVLSACHACGEEIGLANAPALAVEMIHTYSLIHDDLPAMDDDDLRRGKPTSHVVHGEAMAILAGDALHTLAFSTLAEADLPAGRIAALTRTLALAAGADGMAGGQVLDLEGEGRPATEESVARIHRLKTGSLLAACFRMGAEAAGAPDALVDTLEAAGKRTGLAFQIQDDILDETATSDELGKTPGKDREAGKATWPAIVGMEEAERRARELTEESSTLLEPLGEAAGPLLYLVRAAVARRS